MAIYGQPIRRGHESFDDITRRIMFQESRGNPNARSPAGAIGLMQIMPGTAAQPGFGLQPMSEADLRDPVKNKAFGDDYFDKMLQRYDGDPYKSLAAYNWGAGNADKWDGNPGSLPAETRQYISNILQDPRFGTPQYGKDMAQKRLGGNAYATQSILQNRSGFNMQDEGGGAVSRSGGVGDEDADGGAGFLNLNALAAGPSGFSLPTPSANVQSTAQQTQRVQSRYSGPVQSQQLPVAQLVR